MAYILAGDVGGTKTLLALYAHDRGVFAPLHEQTFASTQFPDLQSVARAFLAPLGVAVQAAVFGVAGPVIGGTAQVTNLPWNIREEVLMETLGVPRVRLVNDLEAMATAVPLLREEDVVPLNDVTPTPCGPIGVIAPGTGLGEAFLVCVDGRYHPFPSEGGHADFAPGNELESELLRYLQRKFGRASYERVCSGSGIPNVYAFLRDCAYYRESPYVAEQLNAAADPTPVIVANALCDPPDPLCAKVLEIFTSVLAAKAGNLALTIIATGGIYFGGGLPPRILPLLQRESFMNIFRYKGRLSSLMMRIPAKVIVNTRAGLIGAAHLAFALAEAAGV